MRCRGMQRLANDAYLSGFLCSALLRVAPYCVPGGIRVVSILSSYPRSSKGSLRARPLGPPPRRGATQSSEKTGRKVVRWESPRSNNPSSASLAAHGKEHEMEGRTDRIEGVLRRIEEHIERWRAEKQAREQEVEADRDALWAEAVEREELLAETIEGEESRRRSAGEICQEQKAVFVVHSRETREALEGLSGESVRLVRMVPAEGASARSVGLEGSWLIFE